MYFKIRQRATLVQAPESFSDRYNEGDEVIVETTVDAGVPYTQIVGPAAPKTLSPEAFRPVRTSDETDGAIRIDLPALRAAMGTIKAHAGLINACFKNHNLSRLAGTLHNPAEKMVSTLWFIVEDEWRPQDEPKRRTP